ncbi:ketose-bisphosphate aldolase [Bariatricus massiliensis]|uniref:Ketose-bisphosphate aldolase n=1 Tax=Bariatricus massiliensis TaxID=1745713 RepID=A0ABS8DGG1_9FIRM|nr:ketose-bisphosphate aldolase [Bariatricus massiliensis]MCB7304406.1 ketose-bisphosphate aldolase [Bariatricus massiliensis]MCB7375057.1 ketose-bisphosphate aldolase [Bariatricus massiliensis]MCB7387516.1 ketose-bisphosphate aldolase [Bariatricus massiliensis]MCB7411678.1 ketose-bisphosphate aldolase [Bariatricus massiliensis]MCQ5253813.1 ketose-bisphosphate aldolase [Bariatricus massiliensis]
MLLNMKELLAVANEHNFAVPAFNIGTGQILNGVMDKCEELKAPVILAIHPLEHDFQGDSFLKMCIDRANKSPIPVCIHLDHSEWGPIVRAIRAGFTSVMIDASSLPFEENVAITKKVCELAHPLGVSVEGELGTIGTTDGDTEGGTAEIIYTKPEDAVRFVEETGCDTLAIAIGTAHGIYPAGMKPELKQDLLSEIKSKVSVPLVLHGGSGNKDSEIAEAVKRGINKINISSDIKDAFYQELRKTLQDPKIREPFELYPASVKAMQDVVEHKIKLFNDDDKVQYYSLNEML